MIPCKMNMVPKMDVCMNHVESLHGHGPTVLTSSCVYSNTQKETQKRIEKYNIPPKKNGQFNMFYPFDSYYDA